MEGDWTCHRGSRMVELKVQVPFAGNVVREGAWAFNLCVHGEGGSRLVGPCTSLGYWARLRQLSLGRLLLLGWLGVSNGLACWAFKYATKMGLEPILDLGLNKIKT